MAASGLCCSILCPSRFLSATVPVICRMHHIGWPSGMCVCAHCLGARTQRLQAAVLLTPVPTGGRVLGNRLVTGLTTDPDSGEVSSVEATDRATGERSARTHSAVCSGCVLSYCKADVDAGVGSLPGPVCAPANLCGCTPPATLPPVRVYLRPCPLPLQGRPSRTPPTRWCSLWASQACRSW